MIGTNVRRRPPRQTRSGAGRRTPPGPASRRVDQAIRLAAVSAVTTVACAVLLLGGTAAAYADVPGPALAAASMVDVVNNIRAWLFGLLVAVATLFLTVGGLRLMWANGDPGEAEKGKAALKSAAISTPLSRFGGAAGSNAACTRCANRTSFSSRSSLASTSS